MFDMVLSLLKGLLQFFGVLLLPFVALLVVLALLVVGNILWEMKKGRRFKKGVRVEIKKRGIMRRLFWDFPKQYAKDMLDYDPEFFKYQGCIIYTGRQGHGKTISMVHDAYMMQLEYPKARCISNLGYKHEDAELKHWRQLVDYKNGKHGVIVMMDETQNWFSSNQSKNFPPEMLQVITQNRKNRRIILGTAQNFYLLAKAIRSQATEVRDCHTFFGCMTFVRRREPVLNCDGGVEEWKNLGWYFFVHDAALRESYDTYRVIESLSEGGFKEPKINISCVRVESAE